MTPSRPYLVRAFYEWILDNDMTPYLVIDAEDPKANVPTEYIEDGKIVLNISPHATEGLHISNTTLEFNASFSGEVFYISAPVSAILAIYSRESGRGMVFNEDEYDEDEMESGSGDGDDDDTPPPQSGGGDDKGGGKGKKKSPHLRVVK